MAGKDETLHEGVMTIEGEPKREYGRFIRRCAPPEGADEAKVLAEFEEGVLHVRVPKAPSAAPKTVGVKVA
jgi:HSP20 family molecular chaperone IbpA